MFEGYILFPFVAIFVILLSALVFLGLLPDSAMM